MRPTLAQIVGQLRAFSRKSFPVSEHLFILIIIGLFLTFILSCFSILYFNYSAGKSPAVTNAVISQPSNEQLESQGLLSLPPVVNDMADSNSLKRLIANSKEVSMQFLKAMSKDNKEILKEKSPNLENHLPVPSLVNGSNNAPVTCQPRFLIIGAQKAGMTSLHVYLKSKYHSQIAVPHGGVGTNYFSLGRDMGLDIKPYFRHFPYISPGDNPIDNTCSEVNKVRGEVDPTYLPHPRAAHRARWLLPNATIVIVLRHPVYRTLSAFNEWWQKQVCGPSAATKQRRCFGELVYKLLKLLETPTSSSSFEEFFHYPQSNSAKNNLEKSSTISSSAESPFSTNTLAKNYPYLQSLLHLVEQAVLVEGREATPTLLHSIVAAHYIDTLRHKVQHEMVQIGVCYASFEQVPGTENKRQRVGFNIFEDCVETLRDWHPPVILEKASSMDRRGVYRLMEFFQKESEVMQSIYVDQVRRWLEQYPKEQILFWEAEDLSHEPEEHLNQLVRVLGLSEKEWTLISNDTESSIFFLGDQGNFMEEPVVKREAAFGPEGRKLKYHEREYIVDAPTNIKQALLDFFKPFNQDLYDLLYQYGHSEFADRIRKRFDSL